MTAPSRAPTTALPPEVLKMKALIAAVVAAECTCAEQYATDGRPTSRATLRANAANEALDAALLQFVEDGRRLDWLQKKMRDGVWHYEVFLAGLRHGPGLNAVGYQCEVAPVRGPSTSYQGATLRDAIDAARSVVAAPVGEAEQP